MELLAYDLALMLIEKAVAGACRLARKSWNGALRMSQFAI